MREIDVLPDFSPGVIHICDVPTFQEPVELEKHLGKNIDEKKALQLFDSMLYIRYFEELIVKLKSGTFVPRKGFSFIGATHLSIGQEAVAAGTMSVLRPDDYITSTHRGHGHSIGKGLFYLYDQGRDGLQTFLGDQPGSGTDEELLERAIDHHLFKTFAELFGKEEGYCRGRGGSMHIADFHMGHLGANAIVGGSLAIATGAGLSSLLQGSDNVAVCMVGDGAVNNGICLEAMNFASMPQFQQGFPVLYVFENNQYGMSGQQYGEVTAVKHLAQRGAGYNEQCMHARVESGMHVTAVRSTVINAVETARKGEGPVLLEFKTYRYQGHSLSDKRVSYRTAEEEQEWLNLDPINLFAAELVKNGILSEKQVEERKDQVVSRMEEAARRAANATDPDPATISEGLLSETTSDDIGDKYKTVHFNKEPKSFKRDSQGRILYRHAVIEALMEEMIRDNRVILYGEEVAEYGGAFHATQGLLDIFGRRRVFNTPISEAAIVGTALGAAMTGMRPVGEIMYIDFLLMTGDQLGNQLAKTKYMFGGKATIPVVIRTTIGGGKGYAGQHSQSLEAFPAMFPGLKVVAPFTAYDVKGLLKSAVRDDNPVVFCEHQHLYTERGAVPEEEFTVPLGKANVLREGRDATLISYSHQLKACLAAADMLAEQDGTEVEVVDIRTLVPLDEQLLAESASRTGRAAVVVQAPGKMSFGEHIVNVLQRNCFSSLKAPVELISAHEVPPPMAAPLENENIPSAQKIADRIRKLLAL